MFELHLRLTFGTHALKNNDSPSFINPCSAMSRLDRYSHGTARVLMSTIFIVSGIGKLGSVKDTQQYMEAYGVPGYLIWPAAALEIGGGMMLLAGLHTRWLCLMLSAWCILTASIFHTDMEDQNQKIHLMKNMAMAGGFLVLSSTGESATVGFSESYSAIKSWMAGNEPRSIHLENDTKAADLGEKRVSGRISP